MLQSCFATRIQNLGSLRSFAVNSKGAKAVALGCLRLPPMGSTTLRSKSSALPYSESDADCSPNQKLKVDSDEVQKLTVQQLRQKLRSVGLSATGLKGELVSAWKNFLNSQIDGHVSSQPTPIETKEERKSGDLRGLENVSDKPGLEISQMKRTKRKVKEVLAGDGSVEVKGIQSDTKQSVDYSESGGKKSIQKKGKISLEMTCKKVEESQSHHPSGEPWMVLAHKKPEKDWVVYNPRTMRSPPLSGDAEHVKIMSWNVNGLRALLKLQNFSALELAQRENFDVLCFQETKLQEKDVEAIKQTLIEGYDNSFWTCSIAKLGYSGTAIISRIKPLSIRYGMGISDHDTEGRLVTAEFDKFFLLCAYVPNSGDGLKRLSYRTSEWDTSLSNYMKELEKQKPVILTGDLNCAHEEIDIYDPSGNKRSAGFTAEERQSFESNFLNKGFVDTFRRQHPGVVGYTYWGYRHGGRKTNRGWRLDYFLVSESIADKIHDSFILPDVAGSDHCPIGIVAKL